MSKDEEVKQIRRWYYTSTRRIKFDRELALRLSLEHSLQETARILYEKYGVTNMRGTGPLCAASLRAAINRWMVRLPSEELERIRQIYIEGGHEYLKDDYQWTYFLHSRAQSLRIDRPEFWKWAASHRDIFLKAWEYNLPFTEIYDMYDVDRSLRFRKPIRKVEEVENTATGEEE